MKILISACLVGENCKYNGKNNRNEQLIRLLRGHRVIPVCPEVLGGLPTPRTPSEIREGAVTTRDGICVDDEFRLGAQRALEIARREKPDLIILQPRSPSCGAKEIYDGTFSGRLVPGKGIFAGLAAREGFCVWDADDYLRACRKEEAE